MIVELALIGEIYLACVGSSTFQPKAHALVVRLALGCCKYNSGCRGKHTYFLDLDYLPMLPFLLLSFCICICCVTRSFEKDEPMNTLTLHMLLLAHARAFCSITYNLGKKDESMEYFDIKRAEAIGNAQRSYYQQTNDKIDLRRYSSTRACE